METRHPDGSWVYGGWHKKDDAATFKKKVQVVPGWNSWRIKVMGGASAGRILEGKVDVASGQTVTVPLLVK